VERNREARRAEINLAGFSERSGRRCAGAGGRPTGPGEARRAGRGDRWDRRGCPVHLARALPPPPRRRPDSGKLSRRSTLDAQRSTHSFHLRNHGRVEVVRCLPEPLLLPRGRESFRHEKPMRPREMDPVRLGCGAMGPFPRGNRPAGYFTRSPDSRITRRGSLEDREILAAVATAASVRVNRNALGCFIACRAFRNKIRGREASIEFRLGRRLATFAVDFPPPGFSEAKKKRKKPPATLAASSDEAGLRAEGTRGRSIQGR
jgi:hypothetical protein